MKVKTVSYRSADAGREFAESLRETGFAVVSDHPIPADLIYKTFGEWEGFFAAEDKHRYTFEPAKQAGYFPFRTEKAKDYSKKDLKEFYHYYPWGELPEGTREFTPELHRALVTMASTLLRWLEDATP